MNFIINRLWHWWCGHQMGINEIEALVLFHLSDPTPSSVFSVLTKVNKVNIQNVIQILTLFCWKPSNTSLFIFVGTTWDMASWPCPLYKIWPCLCSWIPFQLTTLPSTHSILYSRYNSLFDSHKHLAFKLALSFTWNTLPLNIHEAKLKPLSSPPPFVQ